MALHETLLRCNASQTTEDNLHPLAQASSMSFGSAYCLIAGANSTVPHLGRPDTDGLASDTGKNRKTE